MRFNHKVKFAMPVRDNHSSLNIFLEHKNLLIEYLVGGYMKVYIFTENEPTKKIIRKRIRGQKHDWINYHNEMIVIPHTYHDKPKKKLEKMRM